MLSRCCIAVFFSVIVLISIIAFVLLRIRAPTETLYTRLPLAGKEETRSPTPLVRGCRELQIVEALLLYLQEHFRLPKMELLA